MNRDSSIEVAHPARRIYGAHVQIQVFPARRAPEAADLFEQLVAKDTSINVRKPSKKTFLLTQLE